MLYSKRCYEMVSEIQESVADALMADKLKNQNNDNPIANQSSDQNDINVSTIVKTVSEFEIKQNTNIAHTVAEIHSEEGIHEIGFCCDISSDSELNISSESQVSCCASVDDSDQELSQTYESLTEPSPPTIPERSTSVLSVHSCSGSEHRLTVDTNKPLMILDNYPEKRSHIDYEMFESMAKEIIRENSKNIDSKYLTEKYRKFCKQQNRHIKETRDRMGAHLEELGFIKNTETETYQRSAKQIQTLTSIRKLEPKPGYVDQQLLINKPIESRKRKFLLTDKKKSKFSHNLYQRYNLVASQKSDEKLWNQNREIVKKMMKERKELTDSDRIGRRKHSVSAAKLKQIHRKQSIVLYSTIVEEKDQMDKEVDNHVNNEVHYQYSPNVCVITDTDQMTAIETEDSESPVIVQKRKKKRWFEFWKK